MSHIIAVVNQKGGVGKTTTTFALGTALASRGLTVLLVDFDPQASLTAATGFEPDDIDRTVYTLMDDYLQTLTPPDLTTTRLEVIPGVDLLPANIDLAAAEFELVTASRREYVLQQILAAAAYDVVLIDCPPSLGILTINALTAAESVLVPVVPAYLSVRGLNALMRSIERTRRAGLNLSLGISGVLLTIVKGREAHARRAIETVHAHLGPDVPILGTIKRSARVDDAAERGVPLTRYAATREIAEAYQFVADELLTRWELSQPVTATRIQQPTPAGVGVSHE